MRVIKFKQVSSVNSIGKSIVALCFSLSPFLMLAQNSLFLSTLGDFGNEEMECLLETSNNGLLTVGFTDSYSVGGDGDALIIKTDINGVVSWAKTYGGALDDMATDAKETADGGFIVAGWTKSFGAMLYDFWVFKIDANGNLQWEKRYGGSGSDQAWSVDIDSVNSSYVVVGGTNSFGAGFTDAWVLNLDLSGNIIWQKTYGSNGNDAPPGAYQEYVAKGIVDKSGRYVISSTSDSLGHGGDDIWLARLNANNGSIIWQYAYGDTDDESTWGFGENVNGGYYLSGNITLLPSYEADLWALHIDTTGNILWQKSIGAPGVWDESLYTVGTADGGVVLGAYIQQTGSDWIAALLKINNGGNLLWYNKYHVAHLDWTNAVTPLSDNTIAFVGVATDTTTWDEEILFARVDANGGIGNCNYVSSFTPSITSTTTNIQAVNMSVSSTTVVPQPTTSSVTTVSVLNNSFCSDLVTVNENNTNNMDVMVFPNPSSGENITFAILNDKNTNYQLKIYNSIGKLVLVEKTSKNRMKLNVSSLDKDLYFYQIVSVKDKEIVKNGKFVLQ